MSDAKDLQTIFSAAIDYLYDFIDFEKRRQDRYMASKLDPSRPRRLMDLLGAPYAQFSSIHIAGTKGKGSVAAMCAYILRAAGYKVGLYTSPHLQDFRERIRILTPADDVGLIDEASFIGIIEQIKLVENQFPGITWFEILTAIAFTYFANENVDVAVVEVGLGGRLDATNVLTPLVSVITSLSLDHTKFLGNTIADIAFEKGGIIKPGIPVISAFQVPAAGERLREIAAERMAPITFVGEQWQYAPMPHSTPGHTQELHIIHSGAAEFLPAGSRFRQPLLGEHQLENGTLALAALAAVHIHLPKLNFAAVDSGLREVRWPGRLQMVYPGDANSPQLLVDCAHNPDSVSHLVAAFSQYYSFKRLWLIFGAPRDKDIASMLAQLVPLAAGVITTTASHPRSATPVDLLELARAVPISKPPLILPSINMTSALRQTWDLAEAGDLICCTGSIMVVGDLLNQWESLESEFIESRPALVMPE